MGNDIRFGIEINSGHGHIHGRDQYPPIHQQPQWDPITLEARQIANELDRGETHRAAEHLRRDLQQMPSFGEQRRLVELVDAFDRKDLGANLRLGHLDRRGGIWDDISITPPPYYAQGPRPGYGGRQPYPMNRAPEVGISIDLNIFKNHNRR